MPYRLNPTTGKYELYQAGPGDAPSLQNPAIPQMGGENLKLHPEDARNILGDMGSMAGTVAEIGSGFVPGSPAMRMGTSALTGGISNALRGESPLKGAVTNTTLQGFGELLTKAPNVMNRLALMMGGMRGHEATNAAAAFAGENAGKLWKIPGSGQGPVHVGAHGMTERRLKEVGKVLDSTREADPNMFDIKDTLTGFSDPLQTKARYAADPLKSLDKIRKAERGRIYSHTKLREEEMFEPVGGVKTERYVPHSPSGLEDDGVKWGSRKQGTLGGSTEVGPSRTGSWPEGGGGETREVIDMKKGRGTPRQTTSEMRKIETNIKHSQESENLRKARAPGTLISADDAATGKLDQAMADKIKEAVYKAEGPNGPMQKADARYADLSDIRRSNEATRFSQIWGDVGKMAARGGLGAGLGATAGWMGAGPVGAAAGSILGPVILSPNSMSHIGTNMGRAGTLIPAAYRAAEGLDEVRDHRVKRKRKTQLRKP